MAAKWGVNALLCMPNRTKCIPCIATIGPGFLSRKKRVVDLLIVNNPQSLPTRINCVLSVSVVSSLRFCSLGSPLLIDPFHF
jgi:hypothetical protein